MFFEAVPLHPSCSNCSSSWSVSYFSFLSQIHSLHSIQKMFVIQELDFRVGKALISTLKEDQVIPALNSLLASYCICDKVSAYQNLYDLMHISVSWPLTHFIYTLGLTLHFSVVLKLFIVPWSVWALVYVVHCWKSSSSTCFCRVLPLAPPLCKTHVRHRESRSLSYPLPAARLG